MANALHYKRREHHEADGFAHFLTFSCYGRLPLFANDAIKDRFVQRLGSIPTLRVAAWVVMPEHVHLVIARQDDARMADLLHTIKRPFAREVLNRWRSLRWPGLGALRDEKGDHFWQEGGGHDRLVHGREMREKIAYTHANPCRRELSERSIDYRQSSAAAYEGLPYAGPEIAFDLVASDRGSLT